VCDNYTTICEYGKYPNNFPGAQACWYCSVRYPNGTGSRFTAADDISGVICGDSRTVCQLGSYPAYPSVPPACPPTPTPTPDPCTGPSGSVNVNAASNGWTTVRTFAAAATVSISATGSASWAGGGTTATPDGITEGNCLGYPGCSPLQSACHMALIGTYDDVNFILIGSGATVFVPAGRTLKVRVNDSCTSDNSGSFSVNYSSYYC
jgi:hypothetical protein